MSLNIRNLFLSGIALGSFAFAAEHTGRVSGQVSDSSGAVVRSATIILHARDAGDAFTAASDSSGAYSFEIPPGEYLIEAKAPGLALAKAPRNLNIHSGEKQQLDLKLEVGELTTEIVVTASGTPQSMDETSKAVDIIDGQEIDRRGVSTLADAIREVPGLRISQRGGPGSFATVQTRGLRTFDTSILIDGMRFRDVAATQGDASSFLSDLLLADTSRIEVLRGAGSSLYGTNSIGGVVNLVTDSSGGPLHGELKLEGGGLGEFQGIGRIGGGALHNRLHYSAGFAHLNVTAGVDGDDRYRNTSGQGLIDYAVRPGARLTYRAMATDVFGQLNQLPDALPNLPGRGIVNAIAPAGSQVHLAEQSLPFSQGNATFLPSLDDPDYYRTSRFLSSMISWQQQVTAPFSYRISYQAMLSNRNIVNGPGGPGYQPEFRTSDRYNGRIDTLQAQANYLLGRHQLLTGEYEFEREFFDSPSDDANPDPAQQAHSRTQVSEISQSAALQDQIRLLHDRLQVSLSGRLQSFSLRQPEFLGAVPVYAGAQSSSAPNAYTGDASVAYFLPRSGTKLRAHVGNGYRKPSLYERFGTSFYGGFFSAYGDPRLKPERSVGGDAGVDQYLMSDRLRVSASYFYTRLQEVIGFDFSGLIQPATDPYGRSLGYRNTGGGIARGVEVSAEIKPIRSTRIQTSYTYTSALDRVSQFPDGTLRTPRIFPHSFSLTAFQQFGPRWDASFEFLAASDYLYPLGGRTFDFNGPRQAALALGYTRPLSDRMKLRVSTRIANLGDQTYYEDGFRTPQRWAVGGMTLSF